MCKHDTIKAGDESAEAAKGASNSISQSLDEILDEDEETETDSCEEERREQLAGRMNDSGLRNWNASNRIGRK